MITCGKKVLTGAVSLTHLVMKIFSLVKILSQELFQLQKVENIQGVILERIDVNYQKEDIQISTILSPKWDFFSELTLLRFSVIQI